MSCSIQTKENKANNLTFSQLDCLNDLCSTTLNSLAGSRTELLTPETCNQLQPFSLAKHQSQPLKLDTAHLHLTEPYVTRPPVLSVQYCVTVLLMLRRHIILRTTQEKSNESSCLPAIYWQVVRGTWGHKLKKHFSLSNYANWVDVFCCFVPDSKPPR